MKDLTVRLNKALADAGICSRRKADELIFAGLVKVNGTLAGSPGERIDITKDKVTCQGKEVIFHSEKNPCWLVLNKPIEVVSTVSDPDERETVMDYIPQLWQSRRLYPVGRLDFFSEGLILLTDDGELAHRLTHPRWHLPRVYHVRVRPQYPNYDLDKAIRFMEKGMTLAEGEKLAPVKIRVLKDYYNSDDDRRDFEDFEDRYQGQDKDTRGILLEFTLYQGVNRQIRRMCRDVDLTILRLKRIAQGPIRLGELPQGKTRELSSAEINALRKAVGL